MKKAIFFPLQISLYTFGYLYISGNNTYAQVAPDGTTNTTVNSNSNGNFTIEQGDRAGNNLFHSFGDFSVPTDGSAFFNNGTDVSNIFSRVTGGGISNIDGLISANGNANLFLINPAGILFGNNARLDIGGSFYGSSASSILFDDGEFSAIDNLEQPLLTVNAPIGLNFRDNPGDITVRGNGQGTILEDREIIDTEDALRVDSDQTFALVGGNLFFEGATIKTAGGRIELGSVEGNQEVSLTPVEEGFSLGYEGIQNFRDIQLSQTATIDASGESGGQINVSGNNISIVGVPDDNISTTQFSGFTSLTLGSNPGEDVNISAQGSLDINGVENSSDFFTGVFTQTLPNSTADAGNINITAETLNIKDKDARLLTRNEGAGNAGNVTLEITDSIVISNKANINTQVSGEGSGNAGDVSIMTNTLELLGGANISVNNQKPIDIGNSGNIDIQARESVFISNSVLSATITQDTIGNVGNINIESPQVSLTDRAIFSVTNSGGGKIGNININSSNISVNNFSLITASSRPNPNLDSSDITTTFDSESSGNITLNSKQVTLKNGGIIDVTTANQSDGGSLNINAEVLEIFSGGVLQTATEGTGNAGSINLNIRDRIIIDGSNAPNQPDKLITNDQGIFFDDILNDLEGQTGIIARATKNAKSNAGNVNIGRYPEQLPQEFPVPPEFIVRDQAQIDVSNLGIGNAGNILITSKTFNLDTDAQLLARNEDIGNGGNVTLTIADSLVIDNGANINVEVSESAEGNAGKINITADTFELLGQEPFQSLTVSRSGILADNDGQGNSGSITINTQDSILLNNSIISSTITDNATGDSGNILIESPQVSLTNNAIISVSSEGNGLGGEININSDVISVDNFSLIAASSRTVDSSGSGDITLNGKLITLSNGGVINATTASNDNAGQININAEVLEIFSGGVLQTATEGNGNAGNITLNISDRIVLNGNDTPKQPEEFKIPNNMEIFEDPILNTLESKTGIFAGATNEDLPSTGGNIDINTKFIVAFPNGNSDILANSQQGAGGKININAESLFGITEGSPSNDSNDIDASSGVSGLDGTVSISTSGINHIQGTTELPSNVVTPEPSTAQACQANREITAKNSFTIKGKGGIPNGPGLPLDSQNIFINGETNPTSAIPQPIKTSQGEIQPARGIKVTKDGKIVLTAYRTNNSGDRILPDSLHCG